MSDWFKWYDDALDESRLQYAINKHPEVVSVWVWLLSQCAKKKRDTVDPICNATLLGVTHKLGIQPGTFNDCIKTLSEIKYIEECESGLKVRKWNELQSDYMRHKKAGYHTKKKDGVRTVYGQCTLRGEERRGEEKREDKEPASLRLAVTLIGGMDKKPITTPKQSAVFIDKLLKRGVSEADVEKTIKWLSGPNKQAAYPFVVESGKSLYEKWDKLQIAIARRPSGASGEKEYFI